MAALRPQSELVEASLRPISAEETKAAEGWPELQLEPASWIEGDQVWVLELQPYDLPNDDGRQLTSEEEEIAKPNLCQTKVPGPNPLTSVPLQEKNLVANACARLSQKSTIVTGQNTCIKNQHICPLCGKGYRWPSDLARHQRRLHDTKTTKQKEHQLESGMVVSPASRPKSTLTAHQNTRTKSLHPCDQCEKVYRWRCDLLRHQRIHHGGNAGRQSEAGSLVPVSLQEKTTFVSPESTFGPKSKITTNKNTCTQNLFICDQCGKGYQWPSNLVRHQHVHHGVKASRQRISQSEAGSLVPVPLQENNTFVSYESMFRPKSKLTTNKNTCTQNLYTCDQCEKGYKWPCNLVRHQRVHHGVKAERQRYSQSESGSLVPVSLQENNTFLSPESMFRPKSKLTTNKNTCTQNLYICDQCGKGYQWPSNLVRHQRVYHGIKTGQQTVSQSQASAQVSVFLQKENTIVSEESTLRPNSNPMADQSTPTKKHICRLCGKTFRWPSEVARHHDGCYRRKAAEQREHQSEVGPSFPDLFQTQEENAFISPEFTFGTNSKLAANQNTHTKNLYICDLCGKGYQWPSNLVRHQRVHHGIKTGQQKGSPSQASSLVSVSFQKENTFVSAEYMLRSKSNPLAGGSTHTKKHICHLCRKGFRWPSELARHQDGCYRRKSVEHQSEAGLSVPVLFQQQEENTSALALRPKSKLMANGSTRINNLHICDYCGMGYEWLSHLTLHQSVHHGIKAGKCQPKGSPLVTLQERKPFVSAESMFKLKSKPMTDQSTHIKKQHICPHCGKGYNWSSDLARHRRVHCGKKATKQSECPSEASPLVHIPLPLKEWHRFSSPASLFRPKSDTVTGQSTCTNHLLTCGQGRRTFQCPSELMNHDRCVCTRCGEKGVVQNLHGCDHSGKSFQSPSGLASCLYAHFGEQETVQRLCQSEAHSPSPSASAPLQAKNVFPNSPEIFSPTSMNHPMNQHTCGQYQNGIWCPLEPAQHPCVHSGGKAADWGQFCSKGGSPSHLMSYLLQTEYFAANFSKMFYPNSQLATDWSTHSNTCGQCGNACQWPPVLDQHQHVHSGVELAKHGNSQSAACSSSPVISIPLPLQGKEMLTNSKQMGDQSIKTQNLHVCSHSGSGFQWPTVTQHPCVHTRGDQCRSNVDEPCLSMSVKTSLQVISTFANCPKANNQNPKQMTDHCAYSKKPNLCDSSEESFQCPSDHTQHEHEHTYSRERPYSCAVCGSRFTRKVQLVKHQRLHRETHDSDEEEEDGRHQGGCVEEEPQEDISAEQLHWLSPQETEELCTPFASSKAGKHDGSPTGARISSEPPPNSILEIGASGQPYIMSLGHSCECDHCETYDSRPIDVQPTEQSSFGIEGTASSDLIGPVCDTSPLSATWGADEKVEDMLKNKGSPASPSTSRQAALPFAVVSQKFKETTSLSTKQDLLVGNNKPYACSVCLKQFRYRYQLRRHLVVHQKKKPYKCKICGNCFAHRSYLQKHQKRH